MTVQHVNQAIVAVADGLRKQGIGKDKKCTGGASFKYRGIDDVYASLSPLLTANNIFIRPIQIDKEADLMTGKEGKMRLVRILVTYEVASAVDGSSVTCVTMGEGCDTSDKASGKALSYAYKNLMFQLFCVPTEGQDDPDQVVHTIETPFESEELLKKAADLEAEMLNCFGLEDLNLIAKAVGDLGLAPNSPTRAHLLRIYHEQKKIVQENINRI